MSKPSFSISNNRRASPWDSIDPNTLEIVDLTGTSPPQPPRRSRPSPISERPSKRMKGEPSKFYISLDDDDEQDDEDNELHIPLSSSQIRHKSPTQSGSLSQAKCVICLDSPTDLSATPCGMSFHYPAS
jgi:hypothetical protein